MKRKIYLLILISFIMSSCSQKIHFEDQAVKDFDINKYLGTWYEIARFNHSFEKGLVGGSANYVLEDNGKVKVTNKGFRGSFDGKEKIARGKAKFAGDKTVGHLKVSFFLWFYADYYVVALDKENYNYALVCSNSNKYLWILSRNKTLDKETMDNLLLRAKELGFDTSKLLYPFEGKNK